MRIGIVVGEASGDILGAGLMQAILQKHPNATFVGIGGKEMQSLGFESLFDMERLSVMGLIEPLFRLRELFSIRKQLKNYFIANKPDVFIGIDSPDFNLGLELALKEKGIRVVHYVSPSVWAWRKKRVFKIKKAVDRILTLLPFEADFYKEHHVPVTFVGHPLAEKIPVVVNKNSAREKLNLSLNDTYIALLPGSRKNELKQMAKLFVETAVKCLEKNPKVKFITSAINAARNDEFQDIVKSIAPDLPVTFFENASHLVMEAADCIVVASGTATLEAMLFKKPMVIVYRLSWLTYQLARFLVKIKFIGLPNLLANEKLVPELIQDDANPGAIANAVFDFLNNPSKIQSLELHFHHIHKSLLMNANQKAAEAVLSLI